MSNRFVVTYRLPDEKVWGLIPVLSKQKATRERKNSLRIKVRKKPSAEADSVGATFCCDRWESKTTGKRQTILKNTMVHIIQQVQQ